MIFGQDGGVGGALLAFSHDHMKVTANCTALIVGVAWALTEQKSCS